MRSTYNQPPFAKINKKKLYHLFLNCARTLEKDTKRNLTPIQIARVILAFSWAGKKKQIMTTESLEELLYLIEVLEKRK